MDAIHSHRNDTVAGPLEGGVLLSALISFLELGGPAEEGSIGGVKLAGYLLGEVSVGESDPELVRVDEACAHDLDDGAA